MSRLTVHYDGWGESWPLGTLAEANGSLWFQYSVEARDQGLELSPLHLPLRVPPYTGFPAHLHRLPGLIEDSLPDGWGLLLMDRVFRQHGVRHPGPLDRLAFIGGRAMGALRFVPAADTAEEPDWNLLALAHQTEKVLADDAGAALLQLSLTGGSPQGARPKALVQYDPASGRISTRHDAPGEPWLVKFPAQAEHKEVCAIEQLYAELARECAIEVPSSQWFDVSSSFAAFGVQRFDREHGMRVPIHSLAGLLHVDFRAPGAADYTAFLRATRLMTRDEREVQKAYERAVFNVLFHNRDDHPKNFAWRLGQDRRWRLAPAFDLTFSDGPMGEHHMDVCGKGKGIRRADLLRLAAEGGVAAVTAVAVIDRMLPHAASVAERAKDLPIRPATIEHLAGAIGASRDLLKD